MSEQGTGKGAGGALPPPVPAPLPPPGSTIRPVPPGSAPPPRPGSGSTPLPPPGGGTPPEEPRSAGGTYPGRRWLIALAAIAVVALGIGAYLIATNDDDEVTTNGTSAGSAGTLETAPSGTTEASTSGAATTEAATTAATTTAAPTTTTAPPPLPTFGAGTKIIGTDIQPGRYLSQGGTGCSFARLRDVSGTPDAVIASGNPTGQVFVDIDPTDAAFDSSDCADWIAFIAGYPTTTFGDGDWSVGANIAPGRWSAPGGTGCTWARTKDFSHTPEGIIDSDQPTGPAVADIAPTDVGFSTTGCGTWTMVG